MSHERPFNHERCHTKVVRYVDGNVYSIDEDEYARVSGEKLLLGKERTGYPGRLGVRDVGGGFSHLSASLTGSSWNPSGYASSLNPSRREVSGRLFCHYRSFDYSKEFPKLKYTASELDALGTTAIRHTIPTNPLSGLGVFIGELKKDGLPSKQTLKNWKTLTAKHKSTRDRARGPARQYLDAQFGLLPFVSDILSFGRVVRNRAKHIKQYGRNSGRNVRRRYNFPNRQETEIKELSNGYPVPSLHSSFYKGAGRKTRTTTATTTMWFSGCFTYYLPGGSDAASRAARAEANANKLFGIRLNAALLWKLAPWSWAIDWVSNVGDVIHNWSAFQNDGLVMRWGYIMARHEETETTTLTGCVLSQGGTVPMLADTVKRVSKQRRRATPYGFGLKFGNFSAKQWSIISALGIAAGPLGSSYK